MNKHTQTKIEQELNCIIVECTPLSGGSIASSFKVITNKSEAYFIKTNYINDSMYSKEANGLLEIKKSNTIQVPDVISVSNNYLILSFIDTCQPNDNFWKTFGTQFAQMHKYFGQKFGFSEDNFIGSTPQNNKAQMDDWLGFYRDSRLKFQMDLALENNHANPELEESFKKLEDKLPNILEKNNEPPSLLHGDLWSGNFICSTGETPYLIDPAVYYGNREADLAMTKLFGGFSHEFYQAYNKEYPLPEGHEHRENIYKLYHVLNHLNLFGHSYHDQALQLIKFYL